MRATVERMKIYPQPARVGPAWYWWYRALDDEGNELRGWGDGLVDLRNYLKRVHGVTEIVEPWKKEARS